MSVIYKSYYITALVDISNYFGSNSTLRFNYDLNYLVVIKITKMILQSLLTKLKTILIHIPSLIARKTKKKYFDYVFR